jgi:hypothetical protein
MLASLIEGRQGRRFLRATLNDLDVMLAAFIQVQLSFTEQASWHTCYLW